MNPESGEPVGTMALRDRAFERLTGRHAPAAASARASSALRVLHDLATAPESAANALALLHELQVYQVELELQDENLRSSVAELETALARQHEVYDAAPVALVTIDVTGVIRHSNLQAAALFGTPRESLPGQSLARLVTPVDGGESFATLVARVQAQAEPVTGCLRHSGRDASPQRLHARLVRDPGSQDVLVALTETEPAAA
jgi:PAS domain-containing protein